MESAAAEAKQDLRGRLKASGQSLAPMQREQVSAQARALLLQQPLWQNVKSVLFYAPLPREVNLWPLLPIALAAGKVVLLPRFDPAQGAYTVSQIQNLNNDLTTGKFGILEPLISCSCFPLNHLDLALVPGLGFDPLGGRLGRGGGFYDRLLAQIPGVKCGVAFDEQMVPKIPVEPHDIRVNCILTPTRWLPLAGVCVA